MSTVNERKAPGLVKQRQLWKKTIVSLCPTFKISRSTTLSTQPPWVWNTGSVKQVLGPLGWMTISRLWTLCVSLVLTMWRRPKTTAFEVSCLDAL